MSDNAGATRVARRMVGSVIRRIPWLRRQLYPSSDHMRLTREEALRTQASGWMSRLSAARQERAYARLMEDMRAGRPRVDLSVAADSIRATGLERPSILEVGCGGGYYSEVFQHLLGPNAVDYMGTDYSEAMIERARANYPGVRFEVADACVLPYERGSVDVVFNGVSLMHILDYERAIAEARRVARRFCIFHTVPLFDAYQTTYFSKYAYGGLVVEMVFGREELLQCFARNGLRFAKSWDSIVYDVYPVVPEHSRCETFLLSVNEGPRQ